MREIKFRLRIGDEIVGYEKYVPGYDGGWYYQNINDPIWRKGVNWGENIEGGELGYEYIIYHTAKDQFTGVLDEEGKEVFEGDYVEHIDDEDGCHVRYEAAPIVFCSRCATFHFDFDCGNILSAYQSLSVVGNIYQDKTRP